MDKKTFLEELRSSLSVLQETELNDIMDEYEQHIDMKVQSGLTEEEAIAEFGISPYHRKTFRLLPDQIEIPFEFK